MVGDPADSILADYYAFGATNFNTSAALSDMVAEATNANNIRPGLNYLNDARIPARTTAATACCNFYGPVSTTLEYNTADFAISAFAGALGNAGDQADVREPGAGLAQRPRPQLRVRPAARRQRQLARRVRPDQRQRLRRGRPRGSTPGWCRSTSPGWPGQRRQRRHERLPGHHAPQLHRRQRLRLGRQRAQHRAALGVRLHRRALPDPGTVRQIQDQIWTDTPPAWPTATTTWAR